MRTHLSPALVGALATGALLLGACGGHPSSTSPTPGATSRASSATTSPPSTSAQAPAFGPDRGGAVAAAVDALPVLLGKPVDGAERRPHNVLTSTFAPRFDNTYGSLVEASPQVTTTVVHAGLSGFSERGASVLAFVDQVGPDDHSIPPFARSGIQVTLVRDQGRWLVDSLSLSGESDIDQLDAGRLGAEQAAREMVHSVLTYTPSTFDAAIDHVETLLTPSFRRMFSASRPVQRVMVMKKHVSSSVGIVSVGLEKFSSTTATVLVFARTETKIGKVRAPTSARIVVSLVRTGGRWLVDGNTGV